MKNFKKLFAVMAIMVAMVCMFAVAACGGSDPTSYSFTGKGSFTMGNEGRGGEVGATAELNEENKAVIQLVYAQQPLAQWTGSWKRNKDKTLTLTFENAESEIDVPAMLAQVMSKPLLNDEYLIITDEIKEDIHSFTLNAYIVIGTYSAPLAINMTQVVEAAE